jgi:PAS domain S-box-containing protein
MDLLFAASFAGLCIVGAASAWAIFAPPPLSWRRPVGALLATVLACELSSLASSLPSDPLHAKAWGLSGCALWSASAVLWLWLATSLASRATGTASSTWIAIAIAAVLPWALALFGRAAHVATGMDFDCTLMRWGGLGSASALLLGAALICVRDLREGGPQPFLLIALATALASTILRALDSDQSAAPPLLAVAASLGAGAAAYPRLASGGPAVRPQPSFGRVGSMRPDADLAERHRQLVEHLPVGVACVDRDLCVVDANPALAELVGAPDVAALLGAPIQQSPVYQRVAELREALLATLEEDREVACDAEWKSHWGRQVHARVLGRPLHDAQGQILGAQLILVDLSSERRLREQLIESQRMEAVGLLAGRIAHDFNNYLSVILGHAELLLLDLPPSHPLSSSAVAISGAAQRSAMLTRRLLSLSRPHLYHPRRVDVNALISDLTPMLRSVVGAAIAVESDLAPALLSVQADPWQLELALMNLTINARDAMPQGGRFRVATREVQLSTREASSFAAPSGRYVVISVSDTGHGMDPATRERIFEPFFTTKEIGCGTGLGLSTVCGVAEQCRGFVRVNSQMGQGSTFELVLPRAMEMLVDLSLGSARGEIESRPS